MEIEYQVWRKTPAGTLTLKGEFKDPNAASFYLSTCRASKPTTRGSTFFLKKVEVESAEK